MAGYRVIVGFPETVDVSAERTPHLKWWTFTLNDGRLSTRWALPLKLSLPDYASRDDRVKAVASGIPGEAQVSGLKTSLKSRSHAASSTAIVPPHSVPYGGRRRGSKRVLGRHDHIACTTCFDDCVKAIDMSQLLLGRFAEMIPFGIARCPPRTEALVKHDAHGRPAHC